MIGLPTWIIGGLALALVALGGVYWLDRGRLAAERDAALAEVAVVEGERDQAVRAAHATEAAFASYRALSLEQDARLTERLRVATRRADAAGKVRRVISVEGTHDEVGPGVAAAIRSRMRERAAPAGGRDGIRDYPAGDTGRGADLR